MGAQLENLSRAASLFSAVVPRLRVPAGSVAIAAGQTGIYPVEIPGGWHIIGRTHVRPFDEARAEPVLFQPGDRVVFRSIARDEYEQSASQWDR